MSLINTLYHGAFKRTSTFFLTVMMGTFVFEKIFDEGMDNLYANVNQGKLWIHIRSKYETEES